MITRARLDYSLDPVGIAATLASARVGTWVWDIRPDRLRVCPVTAWLFGITPDRARIGAPLADFIDSVHAADRPTVSQTVAEVVRRGGLFVAEYRTRNASGEIGWVLSRGQFDTGAGGLVVRGRGIVIDVTDSRQGGFGDGCALFAAPHLPRFERMADQAIAMWECLDGLDTLRRSRFEPLLRALFTEIAREMAGTSENWPLQPELSDPATPVPAEGDE